ncbi:MAG: alpha/beta hydrolase [Prevotella sp.]|nr:alpha/beta hydrolase [Prevotella sp.]
MKRLSILCLILTVSLFASAQRTFDVDLWNGSPRVASNDDQDQAMLRVFLPEAKRATGRAIVICPGGSYRGLAIDHEGYDWGPFLATQGIAAIVLKYRMPHGNCQVPISDAEQAMRLVRANAENWNISANDVGIMGFSAGGHLASTLATHSKGDARPDFQILFYPVISMQPGYTHKESHDNFLGSYTTKSEERNFSNDLQVSRNTPRALIILSDDDDVVEPNNGVNYYTELYRHDVPASLYVYPSGGHGYGIKPTFRFHIEMLLNIKAWLKSF